MSDREPIFNIPTATKILLGLVIVVHIILSFVDQDLSHRLIINLAFFPQALAQGVDIADLTALITFQFLHGDTVHLIINSLGILAFAAAVERRAGGWPMVDIFLICGVAGALGHAIATGFQPVPLVGASGGLSGLFAVVLLILQERGHYAPGVLALLPVTIVWIALNVVFGLMGVPGAPLISVAWIAHIAGFLCGYPLGIWALKHRGVSEER